MRITQAPAARVQEVLPLGPSGNQAATPDLGQIRDGQVFKVPAETGMKDEPGTFGRIVTGTGVIGAAGGTASTILLTADKVAAMPLPDLAHQLAGTPILRVSDQHATSTAEVLKKAAGSSLGQYLVLGVSGGVLAVGIAYAFDPKASLRKIAIVFTVATIVAAFGAYLLVQSGVLLPTNPAKP